jgi:hypothetical protein
MRKPVIEVKLSSGANRSALDSIDWWLSVTSRSPNGPARIIGKDVARVGATLELSKIQSDQHYPKLVGDWNKNTISNRIEIEPGDAVRLNLIDRGKGGQFTIWGSWVHGLGFGIQITELGEYLLEVNLSIALVEMRTYYFNIQCDSERLIVSQC